jgi:peptidoglycan-N-acetylglucosamine deacetylase
VPRSALGPRRDGAFRVALTFDAEHPDRPHRPGATEQILDSLGDAGVRSTWFLQGRWVEAHPDLARRVAAEGHLIGNHTFYHARLPLLTDAGIATDLRAAETVIREMVGVDPRPWFRCPFAAGFDDRRVLDVIAGLGYRDIEADVVLDDWEPERTADVLRAEGRTATEEFGDGAVVLFHAWPPGTAGAIAPLIEDLRDLGATFVGVDELERFAAAATTGERARRSEAGAASDGAAAVDVRPREEAAARLE